MTFRFNIKMEIDLTWLMSAIVFFDIPIDIKMENDLTSFFFRINLKSMTDMSHDIPIQY